jgi:heat shock protein HslJ
MQTFTRSVTSTRTLAIGGLVLVAVACSGTAAAPQPLEGRTFLSTSVTKDGADRPLVPGTQVRISFTDGRIGLSAGCNIMGGAYGVDGGQLLVAAAGMTEMGCDDARHAQDDWLTSFISSRPTLRLTGNDLVLEADGTVVTLADRKVSEPDLALVGPTWTVTSIVSGDTVSSIPDGIVATLQFAADGGVRVRTGCNEGTARAQIDSKTIRFSDIALTKRACEGAAAQMEAAVLSVLRADQVAYRIDSSALNLTAGERGLQLGGK